MFQTTSQTLLHDSRKLENNLVNNFFNRFVYRRPFLIQKLSLGMHTHGTRRHHPISRIIISNELSAEREKKQQSVSHPLITVKG